MKRGLGILLLLMGVELACAQSILPANGSGPQPTHEDSILTDVPPAGLPRLVLPHTTFPTLTDSAYLISPARYRFYQRLHRHALDTAAEASGLLIASYARSLQETQRAYEGLLEQYQAADRLSAQTLRHTQLSLGQLSRTLDQTQYALAQTSHHLAAAEAEARVARRRSLVRRMAYGAGGVGVGLVLGLLLR